MILSDKDRKCSTKEAALWKEPHRGQTLTTCWLQYYWPRSWCHFFAQFDMPVFGIVIILGSWETFSWRNAISACCVSLTTLPTFWANIFLGFMENVRQIIFRPTFSPIASCTNMFDQLAGQHVGSVCPRSVISFYDKNNKGLPKHDLNRYHLSQFPLTDTIWSIVSWERNYMISSHSSKRSNV